MFKITNKKNDVRKFRDNFTGKYVYVQPKKSVIVVKSIKENSVFKVEEINIEKIEEKKLNKTEVKQNDSSKC